MSDSHRNPTLGTYYIYDGDDLANLDALEEEVARTKAASGATRTLSSPDAHAEAVEAYNAAIAEAKPRAKQVVLREIGRRKRRELLAECPPREGNEADDAMGANTELLGEALLNACIASPTFASAEARDEFIESLGAKWFDKLTREAFLMNFGDAFVPKALTAPIPSSSAT